VHYCFCAVCFLLTVTDILVQLIKPTQLAVGCTINVYLELTYLLLFWPLSRLAGLL